MNILNFDSIDPLAPMGLGGLANDSFCNGRLYTDPRRGFPLPPAVFRLAEIQPRRLSLDGIFYLLAGLVTVKVYLNWKCEQEST